MPDHLYPMKMQPAFKHYLWGGTRLREEYGKRADLDPVAESWEISCHPDGPSVIDNGALEGKTLAEALAEFPAMTGTNHDGKQFPLLIKLIDAKNPLSIQVHPGDEYARRAENQQGKNEMWYVLDSAPGAELTLGFRVPAGREEIARRIAQGTLTEIVRAIPARSGDCYCIPAGMLHAIGAGLLIAEIQQNSNVTYRVHDFGRVDADGNPRPLHIEKALDVIDSSLKAENAAGAGPAERLPGCTVTRLTAWDCFHTDLLALEGAAAFCCDEKSCHCLLAATGGTEIAWSGERIPLEKGASAFLPAGLGEYRLEGTGRLLRTVL